MNKIKEVSEIIEKFYDPFSWLNISKKSINTLGFEKAIVLARMIEEETFFRNIANDEEILETYAEPYTIENVLIKKGWFLCNLQDFNKELGIDQDRLVLIIEELIQMGLIIKTEEGRPPKFYYKIGDNLHIYWI